MLNIIKMPKISIETILLSTFILLASPLSVGASTITVNNQCNVTDAVISAESNISVGGCSSGSGSDIVLLSQDVTVSSEYGLTGNAFPVITEPLVFDLGSHTLTHQNTSLNPVRLFEVSSSTLTLKNGTINYSASASSPHQNAGVVMSENGGLRFFDIRIEGFGATEKGGVAYLEGGSLVTRNSTFFENSANDGGVFYVENAPVNFTSSDFINNDAVNEGGVLLTFGETNVSVNGSYFDMNRGYYGGALNIGLAGVDDFFTIKNSQFDHNYTTIGGVISLRGSNHKTSINQSSFYDNKSFDIGSVIENDNTGNISILNTTFSQNESFAGPSAIFETTTGSTYEIAYSTFILNNSNVGMGAFGAPYSAVVSSHLENSIFKENVGGDCILNNLNGLNLLGNLSSDGTCGSTLATGVGALGLYGGSTKLHNLLAGSNAIDGAISLNAHIPCPRVDQRGRVRPLDGNGDGINSCDIGSFEGKKTVVIARDPIIKK